MNNLSLILLEGEELSSMFDVGQASAYWTIAIFLLALPLMWKIVFGPILKALDDRENAARDAALVAESAREETESLKASIENDLAEARREARERIQEAEARATAKEQEIIAAAKDEAENERARTRQEIERAKAAAIEELRQAAIELGVGIAEKAIAREFGSEDQTRLLGELKAGISAG